MACAWPVARAVEADITDATVGDLWISREHGLRGRIVEIENVPHSTQLVVWVKLPGHPDPYPYHRYPGAIYAPHSFTTERFDACLAAACFRHRREVGENRSYCSEHWDLRELPIQGAIR